MRKVFVDATNVCNHLMKIINVFRFLRFGLFVSASVGMKTLRFQSPLLYTVSQHHFISHQACHYFFYDAVYLWISLLVSVNFKHSPPNGIRYLLRSV